MPAGYSLLVTEADGNIITAANRNAEHQNHITNGVPSILDDYSSTVVQMQSTVDPGESGSESQATSLAGEIERLRYAIKEIKGTTYWYETVPGGLSRYPIGSAINLGLTLSGGVLTITAADGTALSTSNMGYVVVPSTTAGYTVGLKVTAPATMRDDAHASSDLTNLGFGITEAVAWANAAPFWLYAVNKSNSTLGGADGNSCFALARNPAMSTTPSSANSIGNTSAIPVTDDQNAILLLGDSFTVANYVSLPCQLIGGITMTWSAANTDWTVGALSTFGGFGSYTLDRMFANWWNFPTAQMGAATGTFFTNNGGTAPTFVAESSYQYQISREGLLTGSVVCTNSSGGTAGAGAVTAQLTIPYLCIIDSAVTSNTLYTMAGNCYVRNNTTEQLIFLSASRNLTYLTIQTAACANQNNASFDNATRRFMGTYRVRVY